mgnify:CR=1 FL=1
MMLRPFTRTAWVCLIVLLVTGVWNLLLSQFMAVIYGFVPAI